MCVEPLRLWCMPVCEYHTPSHPSLKASPHQSCWTLAFKQAGSIKFPPTYCTVKEEISRRAKPFFFLHQAVNWFISAIKSGILTRASMGVWIARGASIGHLKDCSFFGTYVLASFFRLGKLLLRRNAAIPAVIVALGWQRCWHKEREVKNPG